MSDKGFNQLLQVTEWMDKEISAVQEEGESFSKAITRMIEKLYKDRKKIKADFLTEFNEFELTQRFAGDKRPASYYVYSETIDLVNEIGEYIEAVGKVRYLKQRRNSYNIQLIIRMALYWNNPPTK